MSAKAPAIPKRPAPVVQDDEEEEKVQAPVVSKKRLLDGDDLSEPQTKMNKPLDEDDVQAPAAAAPSAADEPPAAPMVQEIKTSPFIVYPQAYKDGFDTTHMSFAKDPQASREGGGQILFMSHIYSVANPENGTVRTYDKPFLWNTPNGMHLPTGITTWPDGKVTTLASCGDGWEQNPLMVAQVNAFEAIRRRCIDVIIEKEWNTPNPNTFEAIDENFTPVMFVGTDAKGTKQYPPSVKASLIITGKNRTEIFEYSPKPPLKPMLPAQVESGSQGTMVLHLAWIYRKKVGRLWKFSVRVNLFQLVAETPSMAGGAGGASVCAVQF